MRRKLLRWGKWAGLAATVALAGAAVLSRRWCAAFLGGPIDVWACGGRLSAYWDTSPVPVRESVLWGRWGGSYQWGIVLSGGQIGLPLWALAVLGAAATALLWWRDRRSRCAPGHCRGCGYSLADLAAGSPCPECGSRQGARPKTV